MRNIAFLLMMLSLLALHSQGTSQVVPPHAAAKVSLNDGKLSVDYHKLAVLTADIGTEGKLSMKENIYPENDGLTQVLIFESGNYRDAVIISGTLYASGQAFPCEAQPPVSGPLMVRHTSGLSRNPNNRAVYDRALDLLISVDPGCDLHIDPKEMPDGTRQFAITIRGSKIILKIQPHYYRTFRGLNHFAPWEYEPWSGSVAGWCSWFAYFKEIDETKMKRAADIVAEELLPYGFTYLQMDDGFQQEPWGMPETWTQPNRKFPSGLESLARYISGKGLKPGIWTYASFQQKDDVRRHPTWFVSEKGEPASGRWVDYIMDCSQPGIKDSVVGPVYRQLSETGWQYFKIDGLRHLRYEGYNTFPDHFTENSEERELVFREYARIVREKVGKENFVLGCWGIRPELTGLIDGCRIGGDGFSYAGLAQYNSYNNVVWRNDPDHVELSETEAYRSCMVTSLTGSLFMLTDPPMTYLTDVADAAKRSAPVLFTIPGQVYDVDPSRSMMIHLANSEVSGEGERPFDASRTPVVDLYLLEMDRPFENWTVLGRTGTKDSVLSFTHLGLDDEAPYHIFEFWSKTYLGEFQDSFHPGDMPEEFNCQLFCFRKKVPHPQVLATNRHISCGGPDLLDVTFKDDILRGTSELVPGDAYRLYITEPQGYNLKFAHAEGAGIIRNVLQGDIRIITMVAEDTDSIEWEITYTKE